MWDQLIVHSFLSVPNNNRSKDHEPLGTLMTSPYGLKVSWAPHPKNLLESSGGFQLASSGKPKPYGPLTTGLPTPYCQMFQQHPAIHHQVAPPACRFCPRSCGRTASPISVRISADSSWVGQRWFILKIKMIWLCSHWLHSYTSALSGWNTQDSGSIAMVVL